jgi:hypothetical protein
LTDDLTAELDRIAAETRTFGASGEDTALLLAAVEAVLALADEWEATAATLDGGTARANALLDCTASFREAITREITGAYPGAQQRGGGDSGA